MFNKSLLRALRTQKGLSDAKLGSLIGTSGAFICQLEKGVKEPAPQTLYLLSRALGCTMDELWIEE